MAIATQCQTPDCVFHTVIAGNFVQISADLSVKLRLTEEEARQLQANLHNAVELVLKPYAKLCGS